LQYLIRDSIRDGGCNPWHTFPLLQLDETGELALEIEEGRFASENFPRRHYPDRVLGYYLSPTSWSTPVSINRIETLLAEFVKLHVPL
jgi:hypothetical protein